MALRLTITDHRLDRWLAWKLRTCPRPSSASRGTTYSRHGGCKLHILVWGISDKQHREIESVPLKTLSSAAGTLPGREIDARCSRILYTA